MRAWESPVRLLDGVRVGALALFVAGAAASARADGVAIPTTACPEGTTMTANHGGHWCRVLPACVSDTDCGDGRVCSASTVALCVSTERYVLGGRLAGQGPTTHSIEVGRGPCDAACVAPARCETLRRCVAAAPATRGVAPAEPASGGCRASRGNASSLALAVLGAIAALSRARQVRRVRRR